MQAYSAVWVGDQWRLWLCVCVHSKRKTAWAINTKLCTHILYGICSACIDLEVRRSKVKVTHYEDCHGGMASSEVCCCDRVLLLLLLLVWDCMSY